MNKMFLIGFLLACILPIAFSDSISGLIISPEVRLGEKITVSGQYDDLNQFILCRFVVYDSNNTAVDRWTDEYTFSDGSFYAEKIAVEPPYYRGDTFNLTTTCGSAEASASFNINQPLGISHPLQMGSEYILAEPNIDAAMLVLSLLAVGAISILSVIFVMKKVKSLAN